MCGRYYIDEPTYTYLETIIKDPISFRVCGDIHPSEDALILTADRDGLLPNVMRWGFPSKESNKLLINARSETALSKPTFSDSIASRRCIIPAKQFYEWNKEKEKVTFTWADHPLLFMAGFYRPFAAENRFIILTTEANDSMRWVHDRMPLIFSQEDILDWILDNKKTSAFLSAGSPMLTGFQEYKQMSLFET